MDGFALLIAATLSAGTVLAIAGLGLLINERSGIVNLGAEGMMLVAAITGFATAVHTGNDWIAFAAGMAAGAVLAAAFGVLVIWLNTNQYATGLALSLFGAGFSAFVGIPFTQAKLTDRTRWEIPGLAEIPFVGPALFKHHPMVYLTIAAHGRAHLVPLQERAPAWCCAPSVRSPGVCACAGLSRCAAHAAGRGDGGWRVVRAGGCVPVGGLRAAVGGGPDRRQAAGSRWR